jgi:hypothetical protein
MRTFLVRGYLGDYLKVIEGLFKGYLGDYLRIS